MRYLGFVCLWLAVSLPVLAGDWTLSREDREQGIRVYTREVPGSALKAFRGEMQVHSRLSSLVALVEDARQGPQWIYQCRALEVIESYSDYDKLLYMVTDAPWPVSDRDSVFVSHLSQDPDSHRIRIEMDARPAAFPDNDDFLRIRTMSGFWEFTPRPGGLVDVVYQVHAEPGGGIPSWLANSVVVDNPYETLSGMAQMLTRSRYRDAVLPHITEAD
ncbi:MAG: START domain-containing protein [Pseudomonadota bacterium]|nr:START domain-containing protein [Pseudomonadota bacterium]